MGVLIQESSFGHPLTELTGIIELLRLVQAWPCHSVARKEACARMATDCNVGVRPCSGSLLFTVAAIAYTPAVGAAAVAALPAVADVGVGVGVVLVGQCR